MKIFVVGSGKLANAILTSDWSFQSCEITKWETQYLTLNERAIILHAGSGRQLKECLEYCSRTKSIFIELSTGSETEKIETDFPLVICPNTSILVLKALNMMKTNSRYFKNYNITITESHQSTKKSAPGTAFLFADSLQVSRDRIISIRDQEIQLNQIRIPAEYLNKHAYHKIVIQDGDDEVTLETKVLGHKTYVHGVKRIIGAVLNNNLETRKYTVLDLIDNDLL